LQHSHDPGRALVIDRLDLQRGGQLLVGGGRRHRHRTGVRRIGEQRTEQHDELGTQLGEGVDQIGAESAPAHIRLDAVHQDQVAVQPGRMRHGQPGGRPGQAASAAVGDLKHRPGDLEIVVVLRIDLADRLSFPGSAEMGDRGTRRLTRVIPTLEGRDDRRRGQL